MLMVNKSNTNRSYQREPLILKVLQICRIEGGAALVVAGDRFYDFAAKAERPEQVRGWLVGALPEAYTPVEIVTATSACRCGQCGRFVGVYLAAERHRKGSPHRR
jgi:hypothetical protein